LPKTPPRLYNASFWTTDCSIQCSYVGDSIMMIILWWQWLCWRRFGMLKAKYIVEELSPIFEIGHHHIKLVTHNVGPTYDGYIWCWRRKLETKYVDDKFEMLVTVLANFVTNILYQYVTNIEILSPTPENCHQHKVTNIHLTPLSMRRHIICIWIMH